MCERGNSTGYVSHILPSHKEVEHQTDDVGRDDNFPIAFALGSEVENEVRHESVDGEELHEIEPVGNLSNPGEDTP